MHTKACRDALVKFNQTEVGAFSVALAADNMVDGYQ